MKKEKKGKRKVKDVELFMSCIYINVITEDVKESMYQNVKRLNMFLFFYSKNRQPQKFNLDLLNARIQPDMYMDTKALH